MRALDPDQNILGNYRNVWICTGDRSITYALVATGAADTAAPMAVAATATEALSSAPTPPAGMIVSAGSASAIHLNWNPATAGRGSGLAGYKIERCAGYGCTDFRQITTTPSPPYSDEGLRAGTTYAYRVRAYDKAGNHGDYANIAVATTMPSIAALPDLAVSAINAPAAGVLGVPFNVTANVTNVGAGRAEGFRLGFYFARGQTIAVGDVFSFTYCDMPPLEPNGTWPCSGPITAAAALPPGNYYLVAVADDMGQVTESNKDNNSGAAQIALRAPQDALLPPAPAALAASASGTGAINLKWNAGNDSGGGSSRPAGYRIERCSGGGCTNFLQIATSPSTTTSHSDSGLTAGTAYAYRLRAFDNAGNSSNYSNTAVVNTLSAQNPFRNSTNSQ